MGYGIATRAGRSRTGIILSIIFCLLIGLGILAGLAAIFITDQKFKSEAVETEGTVIKTHKENRTSYGRRGRRRNYDVFVATVKYYGSDGEEYLCRSKGDKDPLYYQEGQKVKVYYTKLNPANARLDSDVKNKDLAMVVGLAIGLFFIVLSMIAWIKRRPFNKF